MGLQDSSRRPSRRFARSVRKALTVHEESISYKRFILPHCKSIPHEQVQFRAILVARSPTRYAHLSRKVAKGCDVLRLQYKKKSHSGWNCWNSTAVMFELCCSNFELFCSESAGQP